MPGISRNREGGNLRPDSEGWSMGLERRKDMDMRELAKDRLRQYAPKVAARENLNDEIRELQYRRKSLSAGFRETPGGKKDPGGRENMMISCIQKENALKEELYLTDRWLGRIDRALGALTESERELMDGLYIYPEKGAAEHLVSQLEVDLKTIYYRSSVALRKFTTALWGNVEM